MFSFDPSFDAPLIPPQPWPVFDEVVLFSPFSSSSSLTATPSVQSDPLPPAFPYADLASMPIPPSRASTRNKNPNHIPRPRNAFMLFRSAFAASDVISAKIEHDNRHITRIIALCWNRLSDAEKQVWRDKADIEKAEHRQRYPNYRFSPVCRTKKPKKRQVRRNGERDVTRCLKVADLVMTGKCGSDLEQAVSKVDKERDAADLASSKGPDAFAGKEKPAALLVLDPPHNGPDTDDIPPFRSPLLPPQQLPDANVVPQPLVTTTASYVEPQTFGPPGNDAGNPHDDLGSLFHPYQFHEANDSPSPSGHYHSGIPFVPSGQSNLAEPEQPTVPDYSVFTWNQSDNFSYYH